MTPEAPEHYKEALLSAARIRELIRAARGGFPADQVARAIRHCDAEPVEQDAAELASLLGGLADAARARLHEAGIEALPDEHGETTKLPKREREHASNLAVLHTALCMALLVSGRPESALEIGHEGLGWARTAGDYRQQAVLWCAIAAIHERSGNYAAYDEALANELSAARASNDICQLANTLLHNAGHLSAFGQLEAAERFLDEVTHLIEHSSLKNTPQPFIAQIQLHRSHIHLGRSEHSRSIHLLREGLLAIDGTLFPLTRTSLLTRLGSVYLELSQYRQCIECQHEVVRLAGALGSDMIKAWGYLRLGDVHLHLKEYDRAEEAFGIAATCATNGGVELGLAISAKRAQLMLATDRFGEASDFAQTLLASVAVGSLPVREMQLWMIQGRANEGAERLGDAERCFRKAIEIAEREFPQRALPARIRLAAVLHLQKRNDEAAALLETLHAMPDLPPDLEAEACRLQAGIAESRGDLHTVLEHERRAFELERMLLERRGEQTLRNARVMAETDLLEREADLERERRLRLERELADAVMELSERRERAQNVENRLRTVLERATKSADRAVTSVLNETLVELRADARATGSPLHYLNRIDEDFQRRLREQYADLTPKQQRLCGLLRAGLQSKEIAALLGIGLDGLKAQRKRLRKRLGLAEEVSLEKMLAEL